MLPAEQFALTIGLDVDPAVVAVQGDLTARTAPTLRAALDLLVERASTPAVAVDLAALASMDSSGLMVLLDAATRLAAADRSLTLRSAPADTLRILDLAGAGALIHLEDAPPRATTLGPEQRSGDRSFAVGTNPAVLASDLARVGSVPASNAVIDAALRLVAVLASATVEGADGVSVSLERHGALRTVASSDDTVLQMDGHQYDTGQGPCVSAAAEGHWFHSESLAEETRWPAFVPLARSQGIASILSTPLVATDRGIGALNIYSNTERAFGSHQQELAALFATQASGILSDAGADVSDVELDERILDALRARQVIARAQGVLMARLGVSAEAAAAALHRSAREAAVPLLAHSGEVLASTAAADERRHD